MSVELDHLRAALADSYAIDREIGHGGHAIVYLATDLKHGRDVAIKILRPELVSSLGPERFLREIEIAARLTHPRILPLHDSGEREGFLYYVMPYVEGESLRDRLSREQQLPIADAVQISRQVGDALAYAHEQGVIHRDIKPENILLPQGGAVVTDFGIARALDAAGGAKLTETGLAVGTPAYMGPEQATGSGHLDARADQYSLGCVLYEMLVGEPPFTGPPQVVMVRHSVDPIPSISTARPTVSQPMVHAVTRALAKVPADRFDTITDFVKALEGMDYQTPLTATSMLPGSTPVAAGVPVPTGRRRARWLLVALGASGVLAAMIIWLVRSGGLPGTPDSGPPELDASHVAVLYFDDFSPGGELAYLTSGITESLIHELTQVEPLSVISRNGVKPYRVLDIPLDSLARLLNVGSLVGGSIERSGDRLTATMELVDGNSGESLFSQRFERSGEDPLLLRDDIVAEAGRLLGQHLGRELQVRETRAGTRSDEAWSRFQQAERMRENADTLRWSLGDTEGAERALEEADRLHQEAESFDPDWREPIVQRGWIASTRARLGATSRSGYDRNILESGIAHAERALAIEPSYSPALELRGSLRNDLTWIADSTEVPDLRRGADEDLRAAVAGDPTRARAWVALAQLQRTAGDFTEASIAAQRALEADPFLIHAEKEILFALSQVWLDLAEVERAARWTDEGRRRYPAEVAFLAAKLVILAGGTGAEAATDTAWTLLSGILEAFSIASWPNGELQVAAVLAQNGLVDSARAVIRRARETTSTNPWTDYYEANARLRIGAREEALALLGRFLEAIPDRKSYIANDWWWESLREDSVFMRLTEPSN
jgi:serine/threonine-protein kinase